MSNLSFASFSKKSVSLDKKRPETAPYGKMVDSATLFQPKEPL